jgi:hypothetical protein
LLHLLSCRTTLLLHSQQARVGYGRNQVWALSYEARDLGSEAAAVVIDSTVAAANIAAVATACALQIDLTDARQNACVIDIGQQLQAASAPISTQIIICKNEVLK